jgi:hypothetical protein
MKMEGARKGAPDLVLAVPRPTADAVRLGGYYSMLIGWHGLFLELKTAKGIVSVEQFKFQEALVAQGYKVCIVRELQTAINAITTYLTK